MFFHLLCYLLISVNFYFLLSMIAIQLINSLCTEYYQLFHFIILFIAHANCYTQQEAVVRMFVVLV